MTFNDLCNKHGTDKGNTIRECHGYSFTYEKLFEPYRDKQLNILEIGISDPLFPGASLKVLSEYFPKASIFGFDIVDCSHFNIERTVILRGDASSKEDVLNILNTQSEFDIIIDDGSHLHDHHMNCFLNLFTSVKKGGLYIIEDLHAPTSEKTTEYFYSEANEPMIKSCGVKRIELFNNRKLLALYNEKIK